MESRNAIIKLVINYIFILYKQYRQTDKQTKKFLQQKNINNESWFFDCIFLVFIFYFLKKLKILKTKLFNTNNYPSQLVKFKK